MTIINDDQPARNINSLSESDILEARKYIQEAVYDWCKNKPDDVFAVRDLFGGENTDWGGTPLQEIYGHWSSLYRGQHPELSDDELHKKAADQTAKDVGCLVKFVLQNDKRNFKSCNAGEAKGYKWMDGKSLWKYRKRMFGNGGRCECNSPKCCECDSPKCCKEEKCTKDETFCRKRAEAALKRAHEIRKFEIGMLWERARYVATFQTLLFAALGVSFSAGILAQKGSNGNPELTVYILRLIICVVGVYSSFFWCLINKGSKFWHENWERHIDFLEDEFEGKLHKTVLHKSGRRSYSVSRVNISISQMFFVAWFALLAIIAFDSLQVLKYWLDPLDVPDGIYVFALMTVIVVSLFVLRQMLKTKFKNSGKDGRIYQINRGLPQDTASSPLLKWTIYGGIVRCWNRFVRFCGRVVRPCVRWCRCKSIKTLRFICRGRSAS